MLRLLAVCCLAGPTLASDWPMQWKDAGRSRVTDEKLSFPLHAAWAHRPAQPPRPAWPPPPRLLNRMDFDYAPAPVVSGGILCFGSSADDTIRALDARTGKPKWAFTTGGPIRFAPQIEGNRVYAASDDGFVYCLDRDTGSVIWTFRAAPDADQLIGNNRMISRWPVRTGVLIADGKLYCAAGIWPSEGVYVYALDAASGRVIWCNDTTGYAVRSTGSGWRPTDPHSNEFGMMGTSPQGALLLSRNTLVVPCANSGPAAFDIRTGALRILLSYSTGSSSFFLDGNVRFNFVEFRTGIELFGGRITFDKDDGPSGVVRFTGKDLPQLSPGAVRLPFEEHARGKVSAIVHRGRLHARKAYGLALSGNALIVGLDSAVAAEDPDSGRELWRAPVQGEAREIAVADGRIFVGTHLGWMYGFAPGAAVAGTDAAAPAIPAPQPSGRAEPVLRQLRDADATRGFALVVGDADGGLSLELARNTDLQLVTLAPDAASAAALRARLIAETGLYGYRIHVQSLTATGRLPFAPYFANAVIVAHPAPGVPAAELYRVLRPYGGLMLCPGLSGRDAEALLRGTGAPAGESTLVPASGAAPAHLVRGRLEGARNWDANTSGDRRVKWPLRPIWFGGPDSALVMNVGIGSHPPVAANGRYFVTGNNCLTAVDAYNGVVLWTRPIPSATPNIREANGLYYLIADAPPATTREQWSTLKRFIAADGDSVYLRLGSGYLRDQGESLIRVDARTGEQTGMAGPLIAGPSVSLKTPQAWPLDIDAGHGGTLTLAAATGGLEATLLARDPVFTDADAWDLYFDFRPAARRFGLYGPGVFSLRISPRPAASDSAVTSAGPDRVTARLTRTSTGSGSVVRVQLPWPEIERAAGGRPASFGFAAALTSCDGGPATDAKGATWTSLPPSQAMQAMVVQRRLFGDLTADALAAGWATVSLGDAVPAAAGSGITAATISPPPRGWLVAEPVQEVYVGDPGRLDASIGDTPRVHPLTGEPGPRVYRSGTGGCGNPVYSAASTIGRTGKSALGFYDFVDDSGLHFFPGIAANCGAMIKAVNMNASLGLLLFSESRSHCDCTIPIRTSLAFAPAERRLNEDWAMFSDHDADAPIRSAALNFGAFGDRRDGGGTLWLGFPRVAGGKAYPLKPGGRNYIIDAAPMAGMLQVPLAIEPLPNIPFPARTYRVNADRVVVSNTPIPWVYASGLRGVSNMTLRLLPVAPLVSRPAAGSIVIDGLTNEPAWVGEPAARLRFTRSEVRLLHDPTNLYIAAWRPALIDRMGRVLPWRATTTGEDANVHADDSIEVFISAAGGSVVHLGVTASGARSDALAAPGKTEDRGWRGAWRSAAHADDSGFSVELAIPWQVLAEARIGRDALAVNVQVNQKDVSQEVPDYPGGRHRVVDRESGISEPLLSLGPHGCSRCAHFVPVGLGTRPAVPMRPFTVRLHFAELEDTPPGQRVFDVLLQGQTVLAGFDIAKEAGGPRRAVVKEFTHVQASEDVTIGFKPAALEFALTNTPIVSGLEIVEETPTSAKTH